MGLKFDIGNNQSSHHVIGHDTIVWGGRVRWLQRRPEPCLSMWPFVTEPIPSPRPSTPIAYWSTPSYLPLRCLRSLQTLSGATATSIPLLYPSRKAIAAFWSALHTIFLRCASINHSVSGLNQFWVSHRPCLRSCRSKTLLWDLATE